MHPTAMVPAQAAMAGLVSPHSQLLCITWAASMVRSALLFRVSHGQCILPLLEASFTRGMRFSRRKLLRLLLLPRLIRTLSLVSHSSLSPPSSHQPLSPVLPPVPRPLVAHTQSRSARQAKLSSRLSLQLGTSIAATRTRPIVKAPRAPLVVSIHLI